MRVSKLGLKLVTGPRLSFVRVSWPIKHDIAKKIKHHVVIDKTINKNIMSGCFYCFQNKLPSKSVYDKKKNYTFHEQQYYQIIVRLVSIKNKINKVHSTDYGVLFITCMQCVVYAQCIILELL